MSWGVPHIDTYEAMLASLDDQSARLEQILVSHRFIRDGIYRPSEVSPGVSYPDLSPALQPFGALFASISDGVDVPSLFRVFMLRKTDIELTAAVDKLFVIDSFLKLQYIEHHLNGFVAVLCASRQMHDLLSSGHASEKRDRWQRVCAEALFVELFENLPAAEIYEIVRVYGPPVSHRFVAWLGTFSPLLESLLENEPVSAELLEEAAAVPIELDPKLKSSCVSLKLKTACTQLLVIRDGLRERLGLDWPHAQELLIDARIQARHDLESGLLDFSNEAYLPHLTGYAFDFQADDLSLSAEISETTGRYLQIFALQSEDSSWWSTVFNREWPLMERYLRAPAIQQKVDELLVAAFSPRVTNFILATNYLCMNRRLENLNWVKADIRFFVRFLVTEFSRYVPVQHLVEVFITDPYNMGRFTISIDQYISENRAPSTTDECCVCYAIFDEEAVVLCRGDFGQHEMCRSCAQTDFNRNQALRCPYCRETFVQSVPEFRRSWFFGNYFAHAQI